MKKIINKIISFIFISIIIFLLIIIYNQVIILLNTNENNTTFTTNEEVLEEYVIFYKDAIDRYYTKYKNIPKYEDIKNDINYLKYDIKCNINIIYDTNNIYLNDCSINGNKTTLKYGKRKTDIDKNGLIKNEYYNEFDYLYIQNTNNFTAKSDQDINNIIYTIINSGTNNFSFKCDKEYTNCSNHIKQIIDNKYSLTYINGFVHPFNQYKNIVLVYDNKYTINITITRRYTKEQIEYVNNKIDEIINNNITEYTSTKEKIRILHDYIINNSKYLPEEIKLENPEINFDTAYDILKTNYGICMAYSDFMAIGLHKLNIKNYEITSPTHEWNLVYLDNNWYHLDATWDDPITKTNENYLDYKYFLINDETLKTYNDKEHEYDTNIALELK